MGKTLSKEDLEVVLRRVIDQQNEALNFLQDVLEAELPEGRTRFDLLCDRLNEVSDEAKKK